MLLSRPVPVGLDIGAGGVRAVEMGIDHGKPVVRRFGEVALPFGAVRLGEVVDAEAVAGALRELWAAAKFKSTQVRIGLANRRIVVRPFEVPWMEAAELRRSLVFQVQDALPMPVDQAILDYYPLEEAVAEDGSRSLHILLVAAARDMVEMTVNAVRLAGLTPVLVDLAPFALMRSTTQVDHLGLRSGTAEALIDIGAGVTNIIVHSGGVPRFVRLLMTGGEELSETLAERLGIDLAAAEALKLGMALDSSSADAGDRALESAAADLVDEISNSLNYYYSQPGAVRLDRVVLTGGGARMAGLAERLSGAVAAPVEPMHLVRYGALPVSAVAAGLAVSAA